MHSHGWCRPECCWPGVHPVEGGRHFPDLPPLVGHRSSGQLSNNLMDCAVLLKLNVQLGSWSRVDVSWSPLPGDAFSWISNSPTAFQTAVCDGINFNARFSWLVRLGHEHCNLKDLPNCDSAGVNKGNGHPTANKIIGGRSCSGEDWVAWQLRLRPRWHPSSSGSKSSRQFSLPSIRNHPQQPFVFRKIEASLWFPIGVL